MQWGHGRGGATARAVWRSRSPVETCYREAKVQDAAMTKRRKSHACVFASCFETPVSSSSTCRYGIMARLQIRLKHCTQSRKRKASSTSCSGPIATRLLYVIWMTVVRPWMQTLACGLRSTWLIVSGPRQAGVRIQEMNVHSQVTMLHPVYHR